MGDDAFRDGVRRYIAAHAYGNTVTDDLWRSLDAHAARPVRAIARDLTLQAGVPLIVERDARCVDGRTEATLSQQQFSIDAPPVARWHAPVALSVLGGGSTRAVVTGAAPQRVTVPGCGPLVINAGQASYLRVRYSHAGLAALAQRFAQLPVDDRLGLLADTQALALAGRQPMGAWLGLMGQVPAQQDPLVIRMLIDQLTDLDNLHAGLPSRPAFRAFARVGWRAVAGERAELATVRSNLIEALGEFDDVAVVVEAGRQFTGFLVDPASLQGDQREAVLAVVAARADGATWDRLHALAQAATSELEKADYYERLGAARDPAQAARALAMASSGEPPVTVAGMVLFAVAQRHPDMALAFMADHWAQCEPLFGEGGAASVAARFFDKGADRAMLPRLDAFVVAHVAAATRARIVKNAALIRLRAQVREQRLPEADAWIAAR